MTAATHCAGEIKWLDIQLFSQLEGLGSVVSSLSALTGSVIRVYFLLLARYVPNVAKRSVWEQCIYWGPTTDRPTDLTFWKISNSHISAMYKLIRFIFGSRVGFSRSADRMALLPVGQNPRSRPSAVLHNCEWPYLWNSSSGPIRIWFYGKSTGENKYARGVIRLVII